MTDNQQQPAYETLEAVAGPRVVGVIVCPGNGLMFTAEEAAELCKQIRAELGVPVVVACFPVQVLHVTSDATE